MSAQEPLSGKVALVTGASRGIGLATARVLADRGARVALLARSEAPLADAAAGIGAPALALVADVSDPNSVRGAFDEVRVAFGRLDILVNNAVVAWPRRIEDARDEELRATVDTNFLGVLHCTRAAVPLMRESGGGDVVNISSEAVRNPFPLLSVYVATKAAVESLSYALKRELASDGIRVTLLRSGAAATAGFIAAWDPADAARALETWKASGHLDFIGSPMPPEVIAESIVHAVTRPPGASVDFLEIRSSGS